MLWFFESPLGAFALLALGLGGCLYLFLALKIEMEALRRDRKAISVAIEGVRTQLEDLGGRIDEIDERLANSAPGAAARPGLNFSVRSQALRMARRGDNNQQIAAALGVPEKEVELLLKVQQMVRTPAPDAAAGTEDLPPGWETLLKAALEPETASVPAGETPTPSSPKSEPSRGGAPSPSSVES